MRPDFEDMVNRSGGNISVRDAEILYETAMEIEARAILEIGSREGGSSMVLGTVAKETGGGMACIEPQLFSKWYDNIGHYDLSGNVRRLQFASPWVSHDFAIATINTNWEPPREQENCWEIDYLFLDGGGSKDQPHHTRWMLVDYHYWEPLVRSGGRIAFHDWTGKNGVGAHVQRAVSIILETDDLREVIRSESTDRGIIVFEKQRR